MLNELDKELEARGLKFMRYADDCIILVGSSKVADRIMENVSKFIEKKLGLKVNMVKSKVSKPNNIRMCIWKQWKKSMTKYKALKKLGMEKWKCKTWTNSRKS